MSRAAAGGGGDSVDCDIIRATDRKSVIEVIANAVEPSLVVAHNKKNKIV